MSSIQEDPSINTNVIALGRYNLCPGIPRTESTGRSLTRFTYYLSAPIASEPWIIIKIKFATGSETVQTAFMKEMLIGIGGQKMFIG